MIGFSIGGVVAYKLASDQWAEQTVLISPEIVANPCVGKNAFRRFSKCPARDRHLDQTFERSTKTKNISAQAEVNRPQSLSEVPIFTEYLWVGTFSSHFWTVDKNSPGLVFLPGREAPMVDRFHTAMTLRRNAPSFSIVTYNHTLSELDNEVPEVSHDLLEKTVQFFDSHLPGH